MIKTFQLIIIITHVDATVILNIPTGEIIVYIYYNFSVENLDHLSIPYEYWYIHFQIQIENYFHYYNGNSIVIILIILSQDLYNYGLKQMITEHIRVTQYTKSLIDFVVTNY